MEGCTIANPSFKVKKILENFSILRGIGLCFHDQKYNLSRDEVLQFST